MTHTDVLIIGAGPSGLTLANFLAFYGISVRIMDASVSSQSSFSTMLHARTLEIFNMLELSKALLPQGHQITQLTLRTLQQDRLHLTGSQLDNTFYPYSVMISPIQIDKVLSDKLASSNITIENAKTVTHIKQEKDHVAAQIQDADGNIEIVTASYLVSTDDSVHKLLNIETVPRQEAHHWVRVGVTLDASPPHNHVTIHSTDAGLCIITPIADQETNHYQLTYSHHQTVSPAQNDIQQILTQIGINNKIRDIVTPTQVKTVATSQVEHYRHKRVLLLGDAAYQQTPILGQGINLSIADAFNLGWKLAMVIQGQSAPKLLDSYQEERHPIARQVHRLTERLINTMQLNQPSWKRTLWEIVMPAMARLTPLERYLIYEVAQLSHHYKDASTVRGQDGNLRAGQRLPNYGYIDIDGATDIYTHLDPTRHTLFIVGDAEDLGDLADLIQTQYTSTIAVRLLRTSPINGMPCPVLTDISHLLPLKNELAYLIRPDHMIGLISTVQEMRAGAHQMFAQ